MGAQDSVAVLIDYNLGCSAAFANAKVGIPVAGVILDDADIVHVEGSVDPIRDIETIDLELMLADLESCERRLQNMTKKAKGGDEAAKVSPKPFERELRKDRLFAHFD